MASGSTQQPSTEPRKMTKKEKDEAAEAFSQRMNVTPASGTEADRFRAADDRFKALSMAAIATVRAAGAGEKAALPDEIVTTFECWCITQGQEATVAKCGELASEPSDFKLVGIGDIRYMSADELAEVEKRIAGLDPKAVQQRNVASAEAASAMLEWLQAAVAMHHWAVRKQKEESES